MDREGMFVRASHKDDRPGTAQVPGRGVQADWPTGVFEEEADHSIRLPCSSAEEQAVQLRNFVATNQRRATAAAFRRAALPNAFLPDFCSYCFKGADDCSMQDATGGAEYRPNLGFVKVYPAIIL